MITRSIPDLNFKSKHNLVEIASFLDKNISKLLEESGFVASTSQPIGKMKRFTQ